MVTIFTAYTKSDTLNFATINMLTPNALLERFPVTKKAHLEGLLYSLPQTAHCFFFCFFFFLFFVLEIVVILSVLHDPWVCTIIAI